MEDKKLQMVDEDQVENVGIMSGFMDEIDELMGEISDDDREEGDEADMARMMERTPNSPEILMNNLRGDMRSIDARREELADLVGFREAEETPEGVLALLQPILAQQAAPAMPMPAPQGMPQGMPPEMAGMAPPPMPAGPAPAMGGIGGLPMDQGPAPMAMANGGMVQYFQDGSGERGVTQFDPTPPDTRLSAYPIEEIQAALARIQSQRSQSSIPTIQEGVAKNLPMYQELLGSDPKDTQAQMLFDIGQAALGYAGNVGPDGQPLRGSAAARLAGATRELPGRIGARAAGMSKEAQALKMAALQQAQAERAAAIETQGSRFVTLTPEEVSAEGLDSVYTWQRNPLTGELKTLGSRPRVPDNVTVTSGETYAENVAKLSAQGDGELVKNATGATSNIAKLDEVFKLIDSGDVNFGIGSQLATNFDRVKAQFLGDSDAQRRASTDQYLDALLGSDVFTAIGSLGIGARGLDTPAEREFLREVLTGTRGLTADGLRRITELRRQREINILNEYNNRVELGELDAFFDASNKVKRKFEVPALPSFTSTVSENETAQEALARRRREEEERDNG